MVTIRYEKKKKMSEEEIQKHRIQIHSSFHSRVKAVHLLLY